LQPKRDHRIPRVADFWAGTDAPFVAALIWGPTCEETFSYCCDPEQPIDTIHVSTEPDKIVAFGNLIGEDRNDARPLSDGIPQTKDHCSSDGNIASAQAFRKRNSRNTLHSTLTCACVCSHFVCGLCKIRLSRLESIILSGLCTVETPKFGAMSPLSAVFIIPFILIRKGSHILAARI
jgi:hypothetical protein